MSYPVSTVSVEDSGTQFEVTCFATGQVRIAPIAAIRYGALCVWDGATLRVTNDYLLPARVQERVVALLATCVARTEDGTFCPAA